MIVRIWTTGLVKGKTEEYLKFASEYSLPMFKKQSGILGATVLIKGNESQVLSYWNKKEDIDLMESNDLYQETVNKIMHAGLLGNQQSIEIFDSPIHFANFNVDEFK